MAPLSEYHCPACGNSGKCEFAGDQYLVTCPNCGEFQITRTAGQVLDSRLRSSELARTQFCYAIRKRQDNKVEGVLGSNDIDSLIANTPLPKPMEQIDELILHIGNNTKGLGDYLHYVRRHLLARVGAWDEANVSELIVAIRNDGLIIERNPGDRGDGLFGLSLKGWKRYEELQEHKAESRVAFMAMPFGEPIIDEMLLDCFRPAVESTGFELLKVSDRASAGVIDNLMRARIRTATFLISDVTHENRGAYWEAGFAEGLGRPVVYTCEKSRFGKVHFDTNHCHTVLWERDKKDEAFVQLAATIRATLPHLVIPEGESQSIKVTR